MSIGETLSFSFEKPENTLLQIFMFRVPMGRLVADGGHRCRWDGCSGNRVAGVSQEGMCSPPVKRTPIIPEKTSEFFEIVFPCKRKSRGWSGGLGF
jgi:hypothetical protein